MTQKTSDKSESTRSTRPTPFAQTYFHGTKADLKPGELIKPGHLSNYDDQQNSEYIFLSATLDAAIWGAELAKGNGPGRIYLVEPTGDLENDPDLTDQRFPGNPTKSYRSKDPFRVVGEVTSWEGHPKDQLKAMHTGINEAKNKLDQSRSD